MLVSDKSVGGGTVGTREWQSIREATLDTVTDSLFFGELYQFGYR